MWIIMTTTTTMPGWGGVKFFFFLFWFRQNGPHAARLKRYIEIDFAENTSRKAMAIRRNRVLSAALGGPDDVSVGTDPLFSSFPFLFPAPSFDFRQLTAVVPFVIFFFQCLLPCVLLAHAHRWRRDCATRTSVQPSPRGPANASGRLAGATLGLGFGFGLGR